MKVYKIYGATYDKKLMELILNHTLFNNMKNGVDIKCSRRSMIGSDERIIYGFEIIISDYRSKINCMQIFPTTDTELSIKYNKNLLEGPCFCRADRIKLLKNLRKDGTNLTVRIKTYHNQLAISDPFDDEIIASGCLADKVENNLRKNLEGLRMYENGDVSVYRYGHNEIRMNFTKVNAMYPMFYL